MQVLAQLNIADLMRGKRITSQFLQLCRRSLNGEKWEVQRFVGDLRQRGLDFDHDHRISVTHRPMKDAVLAHDAERLSAAVEGMGTWSNLPDLGQVPTGLNEINVLRPGVVQHIDVRHPWIVTAVMKGMAQWKSFSSMCWTTEYKCSPMIARMLRQLEWYLDPKFQEVLDSIQSWPSEDIVDLLQDCWSASLYSPPRFTCTDIRRNS